jgi:multiple sugar transport system ATP-binding protein
MIGAEKKIESKEEDYLIIKDVHKKYGNFTVFECLNLVVKKGEILAIIGPSGAGKTTILKIIAGLEDIESGEVILDNNLINDLDPNMRKMAMVFETYALYPHITVFDNLASSLTALNMDKKIIEDKVKAIAKLLQISSLLDRKPRHLSGGQRQRVALGRALVKPANLYLLDEPIAHLDAKLRHKMIGEFAHWQESQKLSMVYVTHDWQEAITLGDHIIVLNNGEVVQYGTKEQIFDSPNHTFVGKIIGDPPMNLIPGYLLKDSNIFYFKIENTDNGKVKLNPKFFDNIFSKEKEKVFLGIRPHKINIDTSISEAIKAEIFSVERDGIDFLVSIKIGDGVYKTRFKEKIFFNIGEKVGVKFDLEGACFFSQNDKLIKVLEG